MKIFYSWQSDTRGEIGRTFVKGCLEDAVSDLNEDFGLTDADRPMEIDQDTKGVLGDPVIADTIFEKIENSDIIVVDVTLTGSTQSGKKLINSNVAYELGYAHKALSDRNVIKVQNTAFGPASKLPFDLKHRRFPIRYKLKANASADQIKAQRDALTVELKGVLQRYIEERGSNTNSMDDVNMHISLQPSINNGTFLKEGEPLAETRHGDGTTKWIVSPSPLFYARLIPTKKHKRLKLSGREVQNKALNTFRPLGRHESLYMERNRHGLVIFAGDRTTGEVSEFCQIFRNGEIWAGSTYLFGKTQEGGQLYIPSGVHEEVFVGCLRAYAEGRGRILDLTDTFKVELGLIGAEGYSLAVDRNRWFDSLWGPIREGEIVVEGEISNADTSQLDSLLLEFFEEICEESGHERPENWHDFPAKEARA